jgi:hypothetical protein
MRIDIDIERTSLYSIPKEDVIFMHIKIQNKYKRRVTYTLICTYTP